jgi:hypothetical protein
LQKEKGVEAKWLKKNAGSAVSARELKQLSCIIASVAGKRLTLFWFLV